MPRTTRPIPRRTLALLISAGILLTGGSAIAAPGEEDALGQQSPPPLSSPTESNAPQSPTPSQEAEQTEQVDFSSILEAPRNLLLGRQGVEFAAPATSTYDNPSHADETVVIDPETGEHIVLRSGITSWVKDPQGTPSLARLSSHTPADYRQVFPLVELVGLPPGGLLGTDGVATLRIHMDIPAAAQAGDQYTLSINHPLWLGDSSIMNREIRDAEGRVFAVTDVGEPTTGVASASRSMVITLTQAVEEHAEITGFIEILFYGQFRMTEQTVTANLSSPEGMTLGPNQPVRIPHAIPVTNAFSTPGGAVLDNRAAVNPAINVTEAGMKNNFRLTFTPISSGLTPRGCDYVGVLGQGFDSDGYFVQLPISPPPEMICRVEDTGEVTVAFPSGISAPSGLTSGGFRINFGGFFADQSNTHYQIRMSTNANSSAAPLNEIWEGTIRSGVPVGDGASHLWLTTAKDATFTTQEGATAPTVGDVITYTITTVPGSGNNRAIRDVITTDRLPDGLKFLSATNGGTYNSASREVVWPPRILTSTGTFTDTLKATIVEVPTAGEIVNTVRNAAEEVCGPHDTISVCEDDAVVTVDAPPTPEPEPPSFDFEKTSELVEANSSGHLGDEGDEIRYTFTVTNTGTVTITSALLTDDLLGIADHECLATALAPGASVQCVGVFTHVITAEDIAAGQVINHATLCLPGEDDPCEEDSTTTPLEKPGVDFLKSSGMINTNGNEWTGDAGDTITYAFTLKNTGNTPITSALLSDDLLGVTDHECLVAPLLPGESIQCEGSFTHVVTIEDAKAGEVVNHAVLTVSGLPPLPDESRQPTLDPSFAFDKRVVEMTDTSGGISSAEKAEEGYRIRYGFTAANTGNAPIRELLITDTMLGIEGIACFPEGFVLEAGETVECVDNPAYVYTVTEADGEAGQVHNVAIASVPGLPDDEGETTTPVNPRPRPEPVEIELPHTGAQGTWLLVSTGIILTAGGGTALVLRRVGRFSRPSS